MVTQRQASASHRKRRRKKGLCGREGCKVVTGDAAYYCAKHAEKHAEAQARVRARRTEAA